MACHPLFSWLQSLDELVSGASGPHPLLGRHLERCAACRGEHVRRMRLDSLLRSGLRHEAGDPVVPPAPLRGPAAYGFCKAAALVALGLGTLMWLNIPAGRVLPRPADVAAVAAGTPRAKPHPAAPGEGPLRPRLQAAVPRAHPAPSAGAASTGRAERKPEGFPDDLDYLHGGTIPSSYGRGSTDAVREPARNRELSSLRDDFVHLPVPAIADAGSEGGKEALKAHQQAVKVVDSRLFRKVTLGLKGASLEELCTELARQTEVRFEAARVVADDKVTVFVKDRPARELMRGLVRLLDLQWERSGSDGAYAYRLGQSLRARVEEEEQRNRDLNAALLALDREMEAYRPYLGMTPQQLSAAAQRARGPEKERLERLVRHGGWGGLQAYSRLTPPERLALRTGGVVELSLDAEAPERRIPAEWRDPLLQSWDVRVNLGASRRAEFWRGDTPLVAAPEATPRLELRVNRSELGRLSLQSTLVVRVRASEREMKSQGTTVTLAAGANPAARVDNRAANTALRRQPPFTRSVSLRPQPVCPLLPRDLPDLTEEDVPDLKPDGLTSAEAWEEVHRRTGRDILADYATRLYPASELTVENKSLFDALCLVGDRLDARWRLEGGMLLARGSRYYWDKVKEVPNRLLRRWQAHARDRDGLPLADLLEMGQLSDAQLDSEDVSAGSVCLWGLREWPLLSREPGLRPWIRFLASLTSTQLAALSGRGLAFGELTIRRQQALVAADESFHSRDVARLGPEIFGTLRLQARYCPAGRYWWAPRDPEGDVQVRDVLLTGRTRPEVVELARRSGYPAARLEEVRRSEGDLMILGSFGPQIRLGRSRTHGFFHVLQPPPSR